jgi:hypothetical protein
MRPHVAYAVRVEQLAIDTGLWCRNCALPSGARVWFTLTIGPVMSLRHTLRCLDCSGDDLEVDS